SFFQKVQFGERERLKKEYLETLQRGLDEVDKKFKGTIPTLTGIRNQQIGQARNFDYVKQQFSQSTFRTGWVQYTWPTMELHQPSKSVGGEAVSPPVASGSDKKKDPEKKDKVHDVGPVDSAD